MSSDPLVRFREALFLLDQITEEVLSLGDANGGLPVSGSAGAHLEGVGCGEGIVGGARPSKSRGGRKRPPLLPLLSGD